MSVIALKKVLKIMESGEIFSVKYVAYDHNRKTGGRLIEYPESQLLQQKKNEESETPQKKKLFKKNPSHWENYTRNIKIFVNGIDTGAIKKLHIFLMLEFNGEKVYI